MTQGKLTRKRDINVEEWKKDPRNQELMRREQAKVVAHQATALGEALRAAGKDRLLLCEAILKHDPDLDGLFGLTSRGPQRKLLCRDAPWGAKRGDRWTRAQRIKLRLYIAKKYGEILPVHIGADTIEDLCEAIADDNVFDPVADWLRSLAWDGTPRLSDVAKIAFGADENECEVMKRMLVGGARRGLEPGCQLDTMCILRGAFTQGQFKSQFLLDLMPDPIWRYEFRSHDVWDRDAHLSASGCWLVEFTELRTFKKAEAADLKSMLTSRYGNLRGMHKEDDFFARNGNFYFGCTNEASFLTDKTGNRRFWIIDVKQRYEAEAQTWLKANRSQIWAEAAALVASGYKYWETDDETVFKASQDAKREDAMVADDLAEVMKEKLAAIMAVESRPRVSLLKLANDMELNLARGSGYSIKRMGDIMRNLGWILYKKETGNYWSLPEK